MSSESQPRQPLRILLVDDFVEIREILATLLRREGFEVEAVGDGASGWDAFCSGRFDLLITDNDMPVLTGLELVRKVRATPDQLPVIVISGFALSGDVDLASLLQPGAFIEKPFAFPVMREKVKELLNGRLAAIDRFARADDRPLPLQPEHAMHHNDMIARNFAPDRHHLQNEIPRRQYERID